MNNRFIIIVGAPRSGKSYLTNKIIASHIKGGGSAFIYNRGKPGDFEIAGEFEFLSLKETRKKIKAEKGKAGLAEFKESPSLLWYKEKGKIKRAANFALDFKGRAAKAPFLGPDHNGPIMEWVFKYLPYSIFCIDDAKQVFRHGLNSEAYQLYSRANHIGTECPAKNWRGGGADLILIFHSLNHVNPPFWDLATHVVLFRENRKPIFSKIENPFLEEEFSKIWELLQRAPKYSYTITELEGGQTSVFLKQ